MSVGQTAACTTLSQRSPQHEFTEYGVDGDDRHRAHRWQRDGSMEHLVADDGNAGTEREVIAVGEVGQPQDAVDDGQSHGPQREVRPGDDAVDSGLSDCAEAVGGEQDNHDQADQQRRGRSGVTRHVAT